MISIDGYGEHGIITDLQAHRLPVNAWTAGNNVRFRHGEIIKAQGYQTRQSINHDATWMIPLAYDTDYYWLLCGTDAVSAWDGSTLTDITPTAGVSATTRWNGGVTAGVAVLNPQTDAPIYWSPSMAEAETLPGWDATWKARVIRPYRNFWVAGGMTEGVVGTNYPTRYRWSTAAEPGAIPTEWVASAANSAGDDVLEETQGEIIEFHPLRDYLVAYKSDSTFILSYVGGSFVIDNRLVFKTRGILASRCVKEFYGKHFVVTDGDILVHDGQNAESVVSGRVQRKIFNSISVDAYESCFVAPNFSQEEMWFCYPEQGSGSPNVAAVWNWKDGTWAFRDLPGVEHIAYGIIPQIDADDTWDELTTTWEAFDRAWDEKSYNPADRTLVMLNSNPNGLTPAVDLTPSATLTPSSGDADLLIADFGLSFDGADIESYVERRGLKPEKGSGVYMCRAVYPRGEGGSLNVTVGHHDSPNAPVTWGATQTFTMGGSDDKIDCRVTGRYLAVKFELTDKTGVLYGADFDVVQVGSR